VHYAITIADTGQTAYAGATLTNSLTGVLDEATYDNDAAATGGTVSFAAPDLTWTGDLSPGATVTITYSVSVDDPVTGDLILASTVSGTAQTVVTATNVNGDNSAAWSPVIQVSVPSGAVGGTYSAIITHSVA
jgi:hypothetical protein